MAERRGHQRIRGIAVRVVVLLLLGAVVNVAAAWGCVFIPQEHRNLDSGTRQLGMNEIWEAAVETSPGTQRVFTGAVDVVVWYRTPGETKLPPMPEPPRWTKLPPWMPDDPARFDAAGWPFLSLYAQFTADRDAQAYRSTPRRGGLCILKSARTDYPFLTDHITLPLFPIWPGFAINTVFYAAILWPLFAAPGRVRRWRRIRRGLCTKCAYPVGASEVCTECGSSVKVPQRANSGPVPPVPPERFPTRAPGMSQSPPENL